MVYSRNYTVIKRTVFFYRTLVECVNTILELYERFDLIHLRTLALTPPSFSRGDALNYLSVKQHHQRIGFSGLQSIALRRHLSCQMVQSVLHLCLFSVSKESMV